MTNGFMPQQTNGAQPQFAQPQPQQPTPQYQQGMGVAPGNFVPAQQPQQTGGYFNQPQPGSGQFVSPTPAQMPQQFQPPTPDSAVEDTEGYFSGGAAWISWDSDKGYRDGTPRGGMIIGKRIVNQTDIETGQVRYQSKGDTSKPLTMLVLELQTSERVDPDDDGKRNMPVRAGLRKAAKEAFEAVGSRDLEIGGYFYAARLRKEPIPNSTFKRNIFSALYARPGSPDPMAGQPAYQAPTPPPAAQFNPMAAQQNFAQTVQPGSFPQQAPVGQFVPGAQVAQGDIGHQVHGLALPQQPGPIANMPAQAMANFQQGAQFDPAVQAAIGAPMPQQPAQPQQPGFQPGAQPNGYTPTAPGADPQQQPGQWTPFSADPNAAPPAPGQWSPSS